MVCLFVCLCVLRPVCYACMRLSLFYRFIVCLFTYHLLSICFIVCILYIVYTYVYMFLFVCCLYFVCVYVQMPVY